jgi:DNA-directed RNA polymerase specialized sigma24 family protein
VPDGNSVTCLLDGLKVGDSDHVRQLWERYFDKLVRLAGSRLPGHTRRAFDEEDVALSAFQSFCDGVTRGQFPNLADRDDLWRLLATITTRKVIGSLRHQGRKKRGGGRIVGESALMDCADMAIPVLADLLSREPTPEAALEFTDTCDSLFERLEDPTLKWVALQKLEGHSSDEIAQALGTTRRTIDRKLCLIRALWEQEAGG